MRRAGGILLFLLFWPGVAGAETLSLERCLELARGNNPTLRAEALEPDIAQTEVLRARSGYLPRVDFQGMYTVQQAPQGVRFEGRTLPTQEAEYPSASLKAEQTLYDFGRTATRIERARALREAAGAGFRAREQDVLLETVAAYYGVLEARKLREAAAQELGQFADHLRAAESLFRQGSVTRNDVLQAQVELAASRQALLARENDVENRWLRLNYLTGRPEEARGELEEEPLFSFDPEAPPDEREAQGRPELEAQRRAVEAGRAAAEESRLAYWPTLFARGGIDYVENRRVAEQTIYSATAGVRVDLFDGTGRAAERRQALARLSRERLRLQDLEAQARLDLRTAVNDARVAAARVRVAQEAIRQGEENLRINRNRYREKAGTATEVIDAQTLLTRTRTDYYRALYDYQLAVARVRRAEGAL